MMTANRIAFLIVVLLVATSSLALALDIGDMPRHRLAASGWKEVVWDSSGTWQTIDVTKEGITPNSSEDIAPKVTAIINGGSGKRILKFPAGTYQVKSGLNISKSDIQIVGAGSTTKFMLAGGANPGSIYGNGSRSGSYKLSVSAKRGDSTATLVSTSGLEVGDYVIVTQPGSVTRPGASGDETQIFRIKSMAGNKLGLDMKFGVPFLAASTDIEQLNYKQNIKLHNFYVEVLSEPLEGTGSNISLNTVRNVEISKIESNKTLTGHITVFRGREVVMKDNFVYGNFGHDTQGGYQYGYTYNFSTNCMMINNRSKDLRHHFVTQYGTNHTIVAYNRAEAPYNHYADFGQHNSKGCHNNLWEGNFGSEIYDDANPLKSWGTRYTTWFRNHALSKVGSENEYVEYMSIVGNELRTDASGIKTGAPGESTWTGANLVSVTREGGSGTMVWGG